MEWINLAAWLPCTQVEGPGRRAALWLQGCEKRCRGCCNPDFLSLVERELVPVDSVFRRIEQAAHDHGLEGITLLGGEPFLQARGLAALAARVQRIGLSVMIFTGYTLAELGNRAFPGADELLRFSDVVVDGPFEANLPDNHRNWVGSKNQQFHYLSDRYDVRIETSDDVQRGVEVHIGLNNRMVVNGWPVKVVV